MMVAVAALLGGAAYFLNKKDGAPAKESIATGGKVIALPVEKIEGVVIQSASGKTSLTKKDDVWKVDERADFPANYERVHDMLTKLWDLKTVQVQEIGQSQFARLELGEPLVGAGTKIEFKDKDGKSLGTLLLGKKHMKEARGMGFGGENGFPAGRYVVQPGSTKVALISETLDEVEAKPESWIARDFFKIENPSAVTLAGATDAQKWKLTRENATADWKLDGAKPEEKTDSAKASPVATAFANPTFTDVLAPDAKPADTGLDKPTAITIETFDGFTYVLKAGKETNGNQPVTVEVRGKFAKERTPGRDEKPEDKTRLDDEYKKKLKGFEDKLAAEKKFEGRPFLIAKSTLDSVVKDRAALLTVEVTTPPVQAPAPLTPAPAVPAPAPTAPVQATTPPVQAPPHPVKAPAPPANNPPKESAPAKAPAESAKPESSPKQ